MVIEITQAQLDAANNPIQLDLTGGGFAHNGTDVGGDGTYRDIFGSVANLPTEIAPGTIITKNTWMAEDGQKTDKLQVTQKYILQFTDIYIHTEIRLQLTDIYIRYKLWSFF